MDHTLLVLGLLKLQEMHGYQLSDLIDRRLKYIADLKKPTLYHLLAKLEKDGEVLKSVSREGNRPERYTYRLTLKGVEHFHQLLSENLADIHTTYFEDDIGLLFLKELPLPKARAYLEHKRLAVDERMAWLRQAAAQHERNTPAYLTLHHHEMHLETERAWLDELLGQLQQRAVRQDILACLAATEPSSIRPAASENKSIPSRRTSNS